VTDDLVKRLRAKNPFTREYTITDEAADRIEQLEAALKKIAQHDMQALAMDALRPGERVRKKLNTSAEPVNETEKT
jgi:hypothetical protein